MVEICRQYGIPFRSFIAIVDENYVVYLVTRWLGQCGIQAVSVVRRAYPVVGKFA